MTENELYDKLKKEYPQTSSFSSGLALFIVDALTLMFSIVFGFFLVNLFKTEAIHFRSCFAFFIYVPAIMAIFIVCGLYPGIMIPPTEEVKKFSLCSAFSFGVIIFTVMLYDMGKLDMMKYLVTYSHKKAICFALLISIPTSSVLLPASREIFKHLFSKFKFWGVPTVVYTNGSSADNVINRLLKNPYLGYFPAAVIDDSITEVSVYPGTDIPLIPSNSPLVKVLTDYNIKQAIISNYHGDIRSVMNSYRYTITVSQSQNNFTCSQQVKDIAGIIGFSSTHNLTFKSNKFIKRCIDVLFILIFAPILIPIMIILSLLVKFTSKGPVFYGHPRVGKNGKTIKCWKFRSMYIDSAERLEKILAENEEMRKEWEENRKFQHDPRITKFGKFLRKTSLDELPQLFNILVGEMSFIGPRPVTEPELIKYGDSKDYVLSVTPGLSGMWQVSGRSDTGYSERIFYDTYYIQNWSIWLDIWILIKTVGVVLIGRGAY